MRLKLVILSLVFLSAQSIAQSLKPTASAREKITISCAYGTIDTKISEVILREAYWKIGKELIIDRLPPERSLVNANNGEVQGDCQRIEGLSAVYGNLTPLYPNINKINTVLLVSPGSDIRNINDIKGRPIGYLRGIKISEKIAAEHKLKSVISSNYDSLILMLKIKRIDAILISEITAKIEWAKSNNGNIDDINVINLNKEDKLYHYLHRDTYPAIAEPLQIEFTKMQKAGQFDTIIKHIQEVELNRVKNKLPPCQSYVCLEEGLHFLSKKPDTFNPGK
jgi:polar amino acid transport system substrate-binding protein